MKNHIKILRETTPQHLQCPPVLACPSTFETEDGKVLIIGELIDPKDLPQEVLRKLGKGEAAVVVPKALLEQ